MSDENKPHDDHGHEAGHGHDDHAPAPAHHEPVAAETHDEAHGHEGHAPAEAHPVEETHGHGAAVRHHDDHAADAVAHAGPGDHDDHAHGDEAAAHEPAAPDETGGHEEPATHDGHAAHDAPAPHGDASGAHVTPADAAAGGAAAAAAASSKPPVWSDSGDAPFEDVDSTPVYARGKGRKTGSGGGSETFEIIKTIFFALLIALVLRVLLFQPFTIPSASMEPNLYEGDYIVVSKWSYGYSKHAIPFSPPVFDGRILAQEPKRGDIVVFKLPRDNKTDYIKRLIGLPGDRVQMINNVLHINDQPVSDVVINAEDAANMFGMPVIKARETLPGGKTFTIQDFGPGNEVDDTPVYEVPAGHYFMMGDNRDNSVDSRYSQADGVGLVPAENLIGKAEIILFSWSPGASLWNPVSWFSKVRPSRFFTVLD
jgi:signal peptidase I